MSTLEGRDSTGLLVIDVQNGVASSAYDRDGVIGRIRDLVASARNAGAPVVWVRHQSDQLPVDTEAWQIVDELTPAEGEPIVDKAFGDSFEATDLDAVLAGRHVGALVVAGMQTDACVRSTIRGAFARGYDVTLVSDAHSTEDLREWDPALPAPEGVIAHTNAYWSFQSAPGRTAAVTPAEAVRF